MKTGFGRLYLEQKACPFCGGLKMPELFQYKNKPKFCCDKTEVKSAI
jgi:hypothetical protein